MGTRVRFLSIFSILSILLAGCGTYAPPGIGPISPENCEPVISANPYNFPPDSWLWETYKHAKDSDPASGDKLFQESRYAAYKLLGRQAKRWSDSVDIFLPDYGNVRLTITYLSPQLLDTIILNQMLWHRNISLNEEQFTSAAAKGLERIVQRKETLFFITVTTNQIGNGTFNPNPVIIELPILNLALTNASDITAYPLHDEHSLGRSSRLSKGFLSGLVAYQLGFRENDTCKPLIDPGWDTKISIYIPDKGLKINNIEQGPLTWTIRNMPLIDDGFPDENPPLTPLDPALNLSEYIPFDTPPASNISVDEFLYWEALGKFLWEQVTYANSP